MLNVRRRTKITVCIWIVILALACFVLSSTPANAGKSDGYKPEVLPKKEVGTIILWYTAGGEPHNVFIVDRTDWRWSTKIHGIIIDRSPDGEVPVADQVLAGGMFDIQNFGYHQLFGHNGKARPDVLLKLAPFQRRAHQRLKIEEKTGF